MQEIELKFQIPEASLAAIRAELHALNPGQDTDLALRAAYFDTPDRRLGAARMALRVRQEGAEWVQTLKAGGSNTMMRLEDNQPAKAPRKGKPISADLGRHTSTARDALMQALGWQPEQDPHGSQTGLIELYGTDITRTRTQVCIGQGTEHEGVVELALDLGHIHAGALRVPVRELEIESIAGHPMAVITAARDWVARHGLWLDTQTKAHRGDRLARQAQAISPRTPQPSSATTDSAVTDPSLVAEVTTPPSGLATLAHPAKLKPDATLDEAWRAGLESCLEHITSNMSELASQTEGDAPDAAYQLRRGLRRLRALGRLMNDAELPFPHEAMARAATVARQLGFWRDKVALAWIPAKLAALGAPHMALPSPPAPPGLPASPIEVARSGLATELCLDVLAALLSPPQAEGMAASAFKPWLCQRLDRWQLQCLRAAQAFRRLKPKARHALRKRARQLRDVSELYAPLWSPKSHERHTQALKKVLDTLGAIQDEQVATTWYRRQAEQDARALFACGWLKARQKPLHKKAHLALSKWVKVKAPW